MLSDSRGVPLICILFLDFARFVIILVSQLSPGGGGYCHAQQCCNDVLSWTPVGINRGGAVAEWLGGWTLERAVLVRTGRGHFVIREGDRNTPTPTKTGIIFGGVHHLARIRLSFLRGLNRCNHHILVLYPNPREYPIPDPFAIYFRAIKNLILSVGLVLSNQAIFFWFDSFGSFSASRLSKSSFQVFVEIPSTREFSRSS